MFKMKVKRRNTSETIILCIYIILTFQGILEKHWLIFGYLDEFLALVIFGYGLSLRLASKQFRLQQQGIPLIFGILLFNWMGWISTIVFCYQEFGISVRSWFLSNKYFFCLLGAIWVVQSGKGDKIIKSLREESRNMLIIIMIIQILSEIAESSYELDVLMLTSRVVFWTAFILMDYRGKKDYIYISMAFLLLLSTHRAKAYGAIFLIIAIIIWVLWGKKKIKFFEIVVGGLGLCLVAWNKIYAYYILGAKLEYPRAMLLLEGIKNAKKTFPFGTGWATFNSYYANLYYSPVYIKLGWENHYILGRESGPQFLNDAYFPGVISETGWIGSLGIIIVLAFLFGRIQKMFGEDRRLYAAGILALGYMLITTFESTAFAHPSAFVLSLVLGIVVGKSYRKENVNVKNRVCSSRIGKWWGGKGCFYPGK